MTLTQREIEKDVKALGDWYHAVRLTPEYTTPSRMIAGSGSVWNATRDVRAGIDYTGKAVLDLGSLEGMWAFEAEKLASRTVIAGDIFQKGGSEFYERFCFAKFITSSKVALIPNIDINDLPSRLDSVYRAWDIKGGFDIIQCLGLLYHVQNPLLALQQMRRCCHEGSVLLLETAITPATDSSMRFNFDRSFYDDPVTYWIPSFDCLSQMLQLSGFRVRSNPIRKGRPDRISLIADAVPFDDHAERFG